MSTEAKQRELEELRARVKQLEAELAQKAPKDEWPPRRYYTAYHILAGCVLGMFGAVTSLLCNVIGSLIVEPPAPLEKHPLNIIRVYLTFPLGEEAFDPKFASGTVLAIGCCLYIGTGILLGIPFQLMLSRYFSRSTFAVRLAAVTALALAIWIINFYGILSWLQPLLFGGRWIVDLIPPWVAALTHLVFGWTMLLVQPLGTFVPYRFPTEVR
jgi:hypothetical protein